MSVTILETRHTNERHQYSQLGVHSGTGCVFRLTAGGLLGPPMADLAGELEMVYLVHFRVVHEAGRLVGVTGVVVVVVGVVGTGAGNACLAAARRVGD